MRLLQIWFLGIMLVIPMMIVLELTPLKEWSWQRWFRVSVAAGIADMISTLIVIHGYGYDWGGEKNYLIRSWGPSVGFDLALILQTATIITGSYLVGKFLNKSLPLTVTLILFTVSIIRFYASISNLFIPIVKFPQIF